MMKRIVTLTLILGLAIVSWSCKGKEFEGTIEAAVMFMDNHDGDHVSKDEGDMVMIHLWVGGTWTGAQVVDSHMASGIAAVDSFITPQTVIAEFTDLTEGETYWVGVFGGGMTHSADDHLFDYYNADSTDLVAEVPTGITLTAGNSPVSFTMMIEAEEHNAH